MPPRQRSALDRLSADLVARLSKEGSRAPETPGTHLVGGLAKAGVALERLLREVVRTTAQAQHYDPSAFLSELAGRRMSVDRATLGAMAHGLRGFYETRGAQDVPFDRRSLVVDLLRVPSVIFAFIDQRNAIVKEGRDPARAHQAIADLLAFIVDYRRSAGWNSRHR